jgi:hypothetical protein
MPNSPPVLASFPAVYRIGAIVVPMSPLLRPDQSAYIFKDCGAKAVITSPEYVGWTQQAQSQAPELKHVIITERDDIQGTIPYTELISNSSTELRIEDTDNDDLAGRMTWGTRSTGDVPEGLALGAEQDDLGDEVRWNESSQVLITNGLMPAKVSEIALCFELGRATVVVEEDQLSLAIGKHGQNVRLAARLTGWDIDILSETEYSKMKIEEADRTFSPPSADA